MRKFALNRHATGLQVATITHLLIFPFSEIVLNIVYTFNK